MQEVLQQFAIALRGIWKFRWSGLILAWIGVVTPSFLLRKWRHAIVVVLFITAIITPGDVASAQIFMGLPIIALYFLSIGVAALVKRKPREVENGGA